MRVVRTPAGTVEIDPTGRMAGRGAYLCRDAACWETAASKRSLEHALGVAIPFDMHIPVGSSSSALGDQPTPEPDIHEGGRSGQE